MPLSAHVFRVPKDLQAPEQYEDAWAVDPARGLAVIADGATSGIFSGSWARLLVEAVRHSPPDPDDGPGWAAWLATLRRVWHEALPQQGLAWFQKAKLRQGAFSTLLWVQVEAPAAQGAQSPAEPSDAWRLAACAAGDSCLFHFRQEQRLASFPLDTADQFLADPMVVGSLDLGYDANLRFARLESTCLPGDTLVLCTDAVAQAWLAGCEAGRVPAWQEWWQWSDAQWEAWIVESRAAGTMRCDDSTVVLLRVEPVAGTLREPSAAADQLRPAACAPASAPVMPPEPPSPPLAEVLPPETSSSDELLRSGRDLAASGAELAKRLGDFSEQLADHLLDRMSQGWKRLKDSAKQYHDRLKPPDQK
jgi:hypothetical protein